ncbi:hypothetical protein CTI12_AA591070 [Artemisia annua]|uniref:Uncharacterized protein n=1 Tax=Artemisia annua TaxID=35608 RepID=A0A2U1KKR4_ARTAN|nr:hypothetical protein CTI12_AA591070 [Artemisia annua]
MSYNPKSNYVDDARIPLRATYHNVNKYPQRDFYMKPRVVDSVSCRQMFLRSYTFSKKETVLKRTKKCLKRAKKKVVARRWRKRQCAVVLRRVKTASWTAVSAVFRRFLCCTVM